MVHTTKLYAAPHFNIPPSEKKISVLYIELQEGCPYGQCNYCKTYAGIPFRNKSVDEVKQNIDVTLDVLANRFSYNGQNGIVPNTSQLELVSRVYFGGADILEYPEDQLLEIIQYTKEQVKEKTKGVSGSINKIAGYATTRSLKKSSKEKFKHLKEAGLKVIYWGLESGSDAVLTLASKNFTQEDALDVAEKIKDLDLMMSVNIMPGLGGKKYYNEHIIETAKVLAVIYPRWVTFLTLNHEDTIYNEVVKNDIHNRHLNSQEIITQMKEITDMFSNLSLQNGKICSIAAHPNYITPVGNNPVSFRRDIYNRPPEPLLLRVLDVLVPLGFISAMGILLYNLLK